MNDTGYLHPTYPESLAEFGEPVYLSASKGWILKRPIPGTSLFDGMGCYPIFTCENWGNLSTDLDNLSNQLVSLSLVTDPFGNYTQAGLSQYFKDVARPYKEHFVVDLEQPPNTYVVAHHQRNAQKALRRIQVEVCLEPVRFLDEWVSLYDNLIVRHKIKGITRFSREAFAKQLRIPGIISFQAIQNNQIVGMLLWYMQGKVAYYHLGAYSAEGYQGKASFALFWTLLAYFKANGLQWLSLGAGAGMSGNENDGLTRFKRGWATGTRTAFFCGRIFDPNQYQRVVSLHNAGKTHYFPAYRAGEFA